MAVCLIFAFCTACEKDNDSPSSVTDSSVQKVNLTLGTYYDGSASKVSTVWQENDVAGLYLPEQSSANLAYASPSSAGGSLSTFYFEMALETGNNQTIVAFYPADDVLSCESGTVTMELPLNQTGTVTPFFAGRGSSMGLSTYNGADISLSQLYCVMYITIDKGDYAIEKAEISSNSSEGIAGTVALDVTSWTGTATGTKITVTPPSAVDCSGGAQMLAATVAPVTLSKGYTITLYETDGSTFTITNDNSVTFEAGGRFYTEQAANGGTTLVFCGDNRLYMIDAGLADKTGYSNAVLWDFNSDTISSLFGWTYLTSLDDCKPVDDKTKLLVTSSQGCCFLLDIETKEVLFYTNESPNAHSAEMLPNDRIVVACSTGDLTTNNCLELYNISAPGVVIDQVELSSAHGVVWNETTQRLYAIGDQTMLVISLTDWDTESPSMTVEQRITTPKGELHDLTYVDANTLCVAGTSAYLYTISDGTWDEMTLFSGRTALKSVNCSPYSDEIWYTDSTEPEGTYDWSTQTIRHAASGYATDTDRTIKVSDLNLYKVRVMYW